MNENIIELKERFNKVSKMDWIKQGEKNYVNHGCILEKLLGVNASYFEIPDFEGIEIKAKKLFSKSCIKLFNATPDGEGLFEIKRLRDTYGYPDAKKSGMKVLNISVNTNNFLPIGTNYLFRLEVNKDDKKIFLNIYERSNGLIDNQTSWSFEMLEEKLLRKLQILALVDVLHKKSNGTEYYKYTNISFYKLKSFDSFIKLIENGKIIITFKISVFRNGKRIGQTHDHGTSFEIKEEYLKDLYDPIVI